VTSTAHPAGRLRQSPPRSGDRDGAVIAALTVSGATVRLPPARLRLLGRVALEQARALSLRLGQTPAA
jgi:hypothetical protein